MASIDQIQDQSAVIRVRELSGLTHPLLVQATGRYISPPFPSLVLAGENRTMQPIEIHATLRGSYFGRDDPIELYVPAGESFVEVVNVYYDGQRQGELGIMEIEVITEGSDTPESYTVTFYGRMTLRHMGYEEPAAIPGEPIRI